MQWQYQIVSFGRACIFNSDLVARLQNDEPLAPFMNKEALYDGSAHGYIDYPAAMQSS